MKHSLQKVDSKSLLLGILVTTLFFVLTGQDWWRAPSNLKTRFEYRALDVKHNVLLVGGDHKAPYPDVMNEYGHEGWDLISYETIKLPYETTTNGSDQNDYWLFKRQIPVGK